MGAGKGKTRRRSSSSQKPLPSGRCSCDVTKWAVWLKEAKIANVSIANYYLKDRNTKAKLITSEQELILGEIFADALDLGIIQFDNKVDVKDFSFHLRRPQNIVSGMQKIFLEYADENNVSTSTICIWDNEISDKTEMAATFELITKITQLLNQVLWDNAKTPSKVNNMLRDNT